MLNYCYYSEANEKAVDKVADKLQGTGIASGSSAGAASSGLFIVFYFFLYNFDALRVLLKDVKIM